MGGGSEGMKAEKLMDLEEVYQAALRAKESGSTRFCMGAAWRGPTQASALHPLLPAPFPHSSQVAVGLVVRVLAGDGCWSLLS